MGKALTAARAEVKKCAATLDWIASNGPAILADEPVSVENDDRVLSDCQGKCLAVKLGAEVADLSDTMRLTLEAGTSGIISRLAEALEKGIDEGSLTIDDTPRIVAESLYQLWVGASVMVKIVRNTGPFDSALNTTRKIIHITP